MISSGQDRENSKKIEIECIFVIIISEIKKVRMRKMNKNL